MGKKSGGRGPSNTRNVNAGDFGTQYGGGSPAGGSPGNQLPPAQTAPGGARGGARGFAPAWWGSTNGVQGQGQGPQPPQGIDNTRPTPANDFPSPAQWGSTNGVQGQSPSPSQSPAQWLQAAQSMYGQRQGLGERQPAIPSPNNPNSSSPVSGVARHSAQPWTQPRMDAARPLNASRIASPGQFPGQGQSPSQWGSTNGVQGQNSPPSSNQMQQMIVNQMQNPQKSTNSPTRQANIAAYLQNQFGG